MMRLSSSSLGPYINRCLFLIQLPSMLKLHHILRLKHGEDITEWELECANSKEKHRVIVFKSHGTFESKWSLEISRATRLLHTGNNKAKRN